MSSETDCIVKTTVMHAPLERVWGAISHTREFGRWFGVEFDGEFVTGTTLVGRIWPTEVDPEVARMQQPHAGMRFEVVVDAVEPPHRLAFRWHPYAVGDADYSAEPMTLVTFELAAVDDGTRVTITETGFDGIPLERRVSAFSANEHGWALQAMLLTKYVMLHPVEPRP